MISRRKHADQEEPSTHKSRSSGGVARSARKTQIAKASGAHQAPCAVRAKRCAAGPSGPRANGWALFRVGAWERHARPHSCHIARHKVLTAKSPAAHRNDNIRKVHTNINVQTTRKPSELGRKLYWDCQGLYEEEFSERLGQLPAVGCSDSLGNEIFRAASKIYYDHHNNAMVCLSLLNQ